MLFSRIITLTIDNTQYEIFVSPFSLHSKERPAIKSGKIEMLYFYNNLQDDEYKSLLGLENTDEKYQSDSYIINCGQDFEKYYLGSLHVDSDTNSYWGWEGKSKLFNERAVKVLGESLFNPESNFRTVTMFTLTRPSDIHFTQGSVDIES